jgi:DNA-binding response OmpR family regulator
MPKVLVVDDEANILKLVEANLAADGYKVLVASGGDEALRLAHTRHPDLVLLDLTMPGMSGWDVLMAIRTSPKLRKIPVIIMTAVVPDGEEYRIRGMKTDGYLVKPFTIDELSQKVEKVLGG